MQLDEASATVNRQENVFVNLIGILNYKKDKIMK